MTKTMLALIALGLGISASAFAIVGPFPSTILKNQFGETSINSLIGGSNQIDFGFTVAQTVNTGIAAGALNAAVSSIYMHTSTTPIAGNPNPAAGYVVINLSSQYAGYTAGIYHIDHTPMSTASPTPVASPGISANTAYIIAAVGTTTQAAWQTLGLAPGIVPIAGVPFISASPSPLFVAGTGTVSPPATNGSQISNIELVGSASGAVAATAGAQIILRFMAPSFAYNSGTPANSTVPMVVTQPADGTVVGIRLTMKALPSQLH